MKDIHWIVKFQFCNSTFKIIRNVKIRNKQCSLFLFCMPVYNSENEKTSEKTSFFTKVHYALQICTYVIASRIFLDLWIVFNAL